MTAECSGAEQIAELRRAQARLKEVQEINALRREILRLWTLKRYQLIKRGDVPRAVTVRLGELITLLSRTTTFDGYKALLEALMTLVQPYTTKSSHSNQHVHARCN